MMFEKGQMLRVKCELKPHWDIGDEVMVQSSFAKGMIVADKNGARVGVRAEVAEDYFEAFDWFGPAPKAPMVLGGERGLFEATSGLWMEECVIINPDDHEDAFLNLELDGMQIFYKMAIIPLEQYGEFKEKEQLLENPKLASFLEALSKEKKRAASNGVHLDDPLYTMPSIAADIVKAAGVKHMLEVPVEFLVAWVVGTYERVEYFVPLPRNDVLCLKDNNYHLVVAGLKEAAQHWFRCEHTEHGRYEDEPIERVLVINIDGTEVV